jgi:hypothetical protein
MIAIEMDMPKKCRDCIFCNKFGEWELASCYAKSEWSIVKTPIPKTIENINIKPDWCPLIEDRTDIVCPYCNFHFSDEIKFMGHGENDFLKYCPNCGKRVG